MTNSRELKDQLGKATEKIEIKVKELAHYYTNLEPWQRGLLIIALTALLLFSIYYLTKPDKQLATKRESQKEKDLEEKLMRQMAFFKRLKE